MCLCLCVPLSLCVCTLKIYAACIEYNTNLHNDAYLMTYNVYILIFLHFYICILSYHTCDDTWVFTHWQPVHLLKHPNLSLSTHKHAPQHTSTRTHAHTHRQKHIHTHGTLTHTYTHTCTHTHTPHWLVHPLLSAYPPRQG